MSKILNPYYFLKVSNLIFPILLSFILVILSTALYQALIISPPDYQQGEMVRIMYIHVPASWMALIIYTLIAICSLINFVWRIPMLFIISVASAPIGLIFSFISIFTGSLWGKPIWGTWWVWDPRLTSMLILFLLYLSYIIVANNSDDFWRAEKPASIIAVIGFINVPIVKFSVNIWYSLHQTSSVLKLGAPTIHRSMLLPLILMFLFALLYFFIILILKVSIIVYSNKKV